MMNDARSRYVIDKEAIIRSADVSADYTIRLEPSETFRQLRKLIIRFGRQQIANRRGVLATIVTTDQPVPFGRILWRPVLFHYVA
jgi:hypothetical protein